VQQVFSSREQNPENEREDNTDDGSDTDSANDNTDTVDETVDDLEEDLEEDESIMISFSEGAAVEPVFTGEFCKDLQDELLSSKKYCILN